MNALWPLDADSLLAGAALRLNTLCEARWDLWVKREQDPYAAELCSLQVESIARLYLTSLRTYLDGRGSDGE